MNRPLLGVLLLVLALRLPFLNHPVQGDDLYYLYGAQHAQVDPLHPKHTRYVFQGNLVDMRGHPHGPLNPWILGGLLWAVGDVREVPFHSFYVLFSLMAAAALWSLARRFTEWPLGAALLFVSTPAFVINGNSLEADLPFLALWMAAIALFVRAVDQRHAGMLAASAVAGGWASLGAYQAVLLVPILGLYLWKHGRSWVPGWFAILAAPATVLLWQLWERATGGTLPASVLLNYLQSGGYQSLVNKGRNALALWVHAGWMLSPVVAIAAFRTRRAGWIAAAVAGCAALAFDRNPLFWIPVACAALLLAWVVREAWKGDFLAQWIIVFFLGALVIFFAGSARYLLPMAAPVAMLAARSCARPLLWAGAALHLTLGLLLAAANYQHWEGYRQFARGLAQDAASRRVWVNGEWGLRHYLEEGGALPLTNIEPLRGGEIVVSSQLGGAAAYTAPLGPVRRLEIAPSIPLRLISLTGRSGYSSAAGGFLPFEISREPADRLRAEVVLERAAERSYLEMKDPASHTQVLSGIYPDGWMAGEASVLLKTPEKYGSLRVEVYIPPSAPARRVTLRVGAETIAEDTFAGPGAYALAAPFQTKADTLTLTVATDKTYRAPGDQRELGLVVTGLGFR